MEAQDFKQHILDLIKSDERIYSAADNEYDYAKLLELVDEYDAQLLDMLFDDAHTRDKFFMPVNNTTIFKSRHFKFFIEENKVNNSYTEFKNKIGLSSGKRFIKDNTEVVIDFPFKDCILAGGQTTEEGMDTYFEYSDKTKEFEKKSAKRKEVFFNQVLAQDEIDRLLDDKALVNWKRYTAEGEAEVNEIKRDEDGTIRENLIIKGNNLLALHSLRKNFAGKVKLIYIDPPYNTGNDGFKYNDNFNHSTWLTFMKNRLEIANELLSTDGVIAVQCSFHQFAYLKILMLGVFNKHLCDLNIQVRHPDRSLTGDKEFNDVIEYVLLFAKNTNMKMPYMSIDKTDDEYIYQIRIKENSIPQSIECGSKIVYAYTPDMYEVIQTNPSFSNYKKISIRGSIREKNSSGRFFVKYLESLKDFPDETIFKVPNMGDDAEDFRYFYSAPKGNKNGGYYQGMPTSSSITKKQYSNYYNFEKEYNNVSREGSVDFRNGKKPEELLEMLISMFTSKEENTNDIILDYHLGSGTTAAVAHKMGRQYIGIEQMDYIENISVERLKKVIDGEQGGISKATEWSGGGDFIYVELAEWNEAAKKKILESESTEELNRLFAELCDKYFLHYNVKVEEFKTKLTKSPEFLALTIEQQKEMYIEMLDLNQLYVNFSEIEDSRFAISDKDIALSKKFYGKEGE